MYDFMHTKANEKLEAFLDQNAYDESQLIELKFLFIMPIKTVGLVMNAIMVRLNSTAPPTLM